MRLLLYKIDTARPIEINTEDPSDRVTSCPTQYLLTLRGHDLSLDYLLEKYSS